MILNRQRTVRVARPPLELFLRRLRHQLDLADAELTVCMVSEAQIARMNESFRKKKGPTDVLSFPAATRNKPIALPRRRSPYGKRPGVAATPGRFSGAAQGSGRLVAVAPTNRSREFLGDIAISPATARRNAKKFGRSLPDELKILILHGTLHLLGYDHETDRGQMDRVEQRLRRRLGLA